MFDTPALLTIVAIAPVVLWLAFRHWQHAILAVFVLLVFEGALRKWLFPGAQSLIYLAKDVVLICAYLGFFFDSRKDRSGVQNAASIRIMLFGGAIFGCIQIFNPNSPSLLIGLTGFKSYFLYAPIAFILPYIIKSKQHLLNLIRQYLILAIPVAALGFIQIAAGPESFLNTYVSHSEDATALAHFGREWDLVRTSGTFSYIQGYTAFLTFVSFLAIGYNLAQGWRVKNNLLPLCALTLVVGAMFTTGALTPVYTLLVMAPIILWLATIRRILALQTALRLFVILPIITLVALNVSPRAFDAFVNRATDATTDNALDRFLSPIFETIEALSQTPVFGIGIGTTHPAALTIMGVEFPWWLKDIWSETEMARVTVELGAVGLILTLALRILIAALALRWTKRFEDPVYAAIGIALAVAVALGVIAPVMLNATAGLYYWGSLGLILAMRRLEQTARREAPILRSAEPGKALAISR